MQNEGSVRYLLSRILRARYKLAWLIVGQGLAVIGNFVGLKVLTTIMGPEDYGRLALGLTMAGFFQLLVYGPIAQWAMRFYSVYRDRTNLRAFRIGAWKAYIYATVVVTGAAVVMVLTLISAGVDPAWVMLAVAAVLLAVIVGLRSILVAVHTAAKMHRTVAMYQGAEVWLRLGLVVGLFYVFGVSGSIAVLGLFFGTLLVTLRDIWKYSRGNEGITTDIGIEHRNIAWREVKGQLLVYAGPFLYFAVFGIITQYADRWILMGIFGEREVGIYAAMYQIANAPLVMLATITSQVVTPVVFDCNGSVPNESSNKRARRRLWEAATLMAVVMAILVLSAFFFGETLLTLFTARGFSQFHSVLWIMVLGLSIFYIGQLLSLEGLGSQQSRRYILPKGMYALAFLFLMTLLAPNWGMVGIAVALAIASTLYLVAVIVVNARN